MLKKEVIDILTELMTPMKGKRIVDIGTGWGESSTFFSELKPDWTIYTIDGFGLYGDGRIYNEYSQDKVKVINGKLGKNVIQILGDSSKIPWELPIDVLFIDADHTYKGCKADFDRYSPFVTKGGLIVFDDYTQENNHNNGVKAVVQEVKDGYELVYEGYYCAILKNSKW